MSNTAYCFDLDGTVTTQEILPLIAHEVDLFEEIQVLTEATLKGIIPFEKSFRLRCKLFSDIPQHTIRNIINSIPLESAIVDFILNHQSQCFIITGNLDVWVNPLLEKLGCGGFTSRAEYQENNLLRLTHVLNKGEAVQMLRQDFDRIIAVGDSMNDVPMFEAADIGIAYGGVHEPVPSLLDVANYVTANGDGLCRLLNML